MAFLLKTVLWPLSLVYRFAIAIWDFYWSKVDKVKLNCRVISVGNITVGGTGKTPMVIYLAKLAVESGLKTSVVARGYKRRSSGLIELNNNSTWQQAGDEPLEIYRLTENVQVYVHESKTKAAQKAYGDGAQVIIVDDGFQHRKLHRDCDIVCLDWRQPFGSGQLLPLGKLREPIKNLKRADMIIYTSYKTLLATPNDVTFNGDKLYAIPQISGFLNLKTKALEKPNFVKSKKIVTFCGLGNPIKFAESLRPLDCEIIASISYSDHYRYRQTEINRLISAAKKRNVDCLVTTLKDGVKIDSFDFAGFDIYSAMLDISITDKDGHDQKDHLKRRLGFE